MASLDSTSGGCRGCRKTGAAPPRSPGGGPAFLRNAGQVGEHVEYYASLSSGRVGLGADSIFFEQPSWLVRQEFGASAVRALDGFACVPGRYTFLRGGARRWSATAYAGVRYRQVWPAVDCLVRLEATGMKQEFVVRPRGDASSIRLIYHGVTGLHLDDGALVITTPAGELRDSKPVAYQDGRHGRVPVCADFRLGAGNTVSFALGDHDPGRAVVIDPTLTWSTYLGGTFDEDVNAVAADAEGNVYVTGRTRSGDFPISAGAQQPDKASDVAPDAFVTKLRADGSGVVFSTFLGGSRGDSGTGIAVDATGAVYLTGTTTSPNFPTVNPAQPTAGGIDPVVTDSFVAKLSPDGSDLVYSTYLGGDGSDAAAAIAVDGSGCAYVTGRTSSTNFPVVGAVQPQSASAPIGDAFVTKVAADGGSFVYSTYLGGSDEDQGRDIAVDGDGHAYVTGVTFSADFPLTAEPLQPGIGTSATEPNPSLPASSGSFVTKLTIDGAGRVYSTYLGREHHRAATIAVDAAGSAYVAGVKIAPFFPSSNPDSQPVLGGPSTLFVAKLAPDGRGYAYRTGLTVGDNDLTVTGIAVDSTGRAAIAGRTGSASLPTINPVQPARHGSLDAFVARFDPGGTPDFATYLGGTGTSEATGVAFGPGGRIYVAGTTTGEDFPLEHPLQTTKLGVTEGFVAAITVDPPATSVAVDRVVPSAVANTGSSLITIQGSGLPDGLRLALVRAGSPRRTGDATFVEPGGTVARAVFDLTGAALGAWDLVADLPDGTVTTLAEAVSVEPGGPPQVWVDLVGRGQVRPGVPSTFTVTFGNRWNRDALLVPLWVTGIPLDATAEINVELLPLPPFPLGEPLAARLTPAFLRTENFQFLALLIPVLPAGSSGSLRLTITPATLGAMELTAFASQPMAQSAVNPDGVGCGLAAFGLGTEIASALLLPHHDCVRKAAAFGVTALTDIAEIGYGAAAHGEVNFLSFGAMEFGLLELALACAKVALPPPLRLLLEGGVILQSGLNALNECFPGWQDALAKLLSSVVGAIDPNDIVGPQGFGDPRYIVGDGPMPYEIFFENKAQATAPAQTVVIEDVLDPELFDLTTVRFGDLVIGARRVPIDSAELAVQLDLRPGNNLLVDVTGQVDTGTGLVTWRFRSIDPATGDPPEDALAGFLPPDITPPEGEGSVALTVALRPGLASGTDVTNRASIVFDQNPPIATPTWSNRLDRDAPASGITPVPFPSRSTHLELTWAGEDPTSEIRDFAVLVSTDGGPFRTWIDRTGTLGAVFIGEPGHSYAFVTVARDVAGNSEAMPERPDTIAVISPDAHSPFSFEVQGSDEDGWTWSVTAPDGSLLARSAIKEPTRDAARSAAVIFRDQARWAVIDEADDATGP